MATIPQVDDTFINQFEADIYDKLEKEWAGLPATVRRDTIIGADSKQYPKGAQELTVGEKGRNAEVPLQHPTYGEVTLTISDVFAARLLDKVDEMKTNVSLYDHHVRGFAGGFMRNRDTMIGEGMKSRCQTAANGDTPAGKVITAYDDDANDVLDITLYRSMAQYAEDNYWSRGNWFHPMSPALWFQEFTNLDEVKDSDYVPEGMLPFGDTDWVPTKKFMGFFCWAQHDLPVTAIDATGQVRHCFFYHRDAVIYGVQSPFTMTTAWENMKQAHSFVASESHGTVVIDETGLVMLDKYELLSNPLVSDYT